MEQDRQQGIGKTCGQGICQRGGHGHQQRGQRGGHGPIKGLVIREREAELYPMKSGPSSLIMW